MSIYLFELFLDQVLLYEDIEEEQINVIVKAGNLLDFTLPVSRNTQNKTDLLRSKAYIGGKSIIFSSKVELVIEALEKNIVLTVTLDDVIYGSAKIHWSPNFSEEIKKLTNNSAHIREINKYDIMKDGKKTGTIDANMIIICYGLTIEVPIAGSSDSSIRIPVLIPKYSTARMQSKKYSTMVGEPWTLFNSPYRQKKSEIDMGLMIYAQMAGVTDAVMDSKRLTAEYINANLCGHKECPGAQKFREWGIGPLAPNGAGLGTIGTIKDTKPVGLYGMSQAYGTMEHYGAYGLFVDKTNAKKKSECGSPVCPFTDFYRRDTKYDVNPPKICCEGNKNRMNKCTCTCCGKKKKEYPSTCEDINCPVEWKRAHEKYQCKGLICPHTNFDECKELAKLCGSPDCQFQKEDPTCQGERCPYNEKHKDKCCVNKDCPTVNPNRRTEPQSSSKKIKSQVTVVSPRRQSAGADKNSLECNDKCSYTGSFVYGFGYASTSNWRSQKNLPNCCTDPNCSFMNVTTRDDEKTTDDTTESSWSKPPKGPMDKSAQKKSKINQEVIISREDDKFFPDTNNICGDSDCKAYKTDDDKVKQTTFNITQADEERAKRITLLVNQGGNNMLITPRNKSLQSDALIKNLLSSNQVISDVVSFDEDDDEMIYLISRLLDQRQDTYSLNNFYKDDFFRESRMVERNAFAIRSLETEVIKPKQKHRGPCNQKSCKYMKYKTCSECGGISRSGATCDHTDVSFSNLSYSDDYSCTKNSPTEVDYSYDREIERKPMKQVEVVDNKTDKIKINKEDKNIPKYPEKKHVDIKRKFKRRSRFMYNIGEEYPGIRTGHKTCRVNDRAIGNVPAHMGWLWNVKPDGIKRRRKNWKPGMINNTINERIIAYRKKRGIPDPPELKMILPRMKVKKHMHHHDDDENNESDEEETSPKPTLIIQKKDGNYLITVNPLKDPKTLAPYEYPYMKCKPMQFVIVKPKPPPKPPSPQRPQYGDGEGEGEESYYGSFYKNCYCDEGDKDSYIESSSSESELNIEFTTPAGLIYPEELKRPPNIVHTETQFKDEDFNCKDCPTILPRKYNKKNKAKMKQVKIKT